MDKRQRERNRLLPQLSTETHPRRTHRSRTRNLLT
uniref:Uncharacterized protein n=1 Tax=Anguilla anguilla TaxID=7936 RepID=A0A0E9WBN2_ANGAN